MTTDDPHADLKQHRMTPEMIRAARVAVPEKIRKRREHFVRVPMIWVEKLAKARYTATYRVALHVLYRHWRSGGKPFTLSNGMLLMEGVAKGTKWRALRELEQFDLITIERRKRKTPRIAVNV